MKLSKKEIIKEIELGKNDHKYDEKRRKLEKHSETEEEALSLHKNDS